MLLDGCDAICSVLFALLELVAVLALLDPVSSHVVVNRAWMRVFLNHMNFREFSWHRLFLSKTVDIVELGCGDFSEFGAFPRVLGDSVVLLGQVELFD